MLWLSRALLMVLTWSSKDPDFIPYSARRWMVIIFWHCNNQGTWIWICEPSYIKGQVSQALGVEYSSSSTLPLTEEFLFSYTLVEMYLIFSTCIPTCKRLAHQKVYFYRYLWVGTRPTNSLQLFLSVVPPLGHVLIFLKFLLSSTSGFN